MNKWIEEFAGFASRNRRRTAAEGKLIGGCCADAVEPQHTENFSFLLSARLLPSRRCRATSLTEGGKRVVFAKHCRAKYTVNFFKRYKSLSGLRYARCARYALWARYTPSACDMSAARLHYSPFESERSTHETHHYRHPDPLDSLRKSACLHQYRKNQHARRYNRSSNIGKPDADRYGCRMECRRRQ